ncbi:MAG TPA: class I SAM-dependent methyltransferase [Chthoniobacterales bacterium]|nr:class I SAM-dependent methyltransferase [Chthoniobacterales bacterium]
MTRTNSYSRHWFEFFHAPIGDDRTAREVEFVCSVAPLPEFRRVLDVCCGMGRHARVLARRGYSVMGIERDTEAIAYARELGGGPEYLHADVHEHQPATSAYDVAIIMSQSFGFFDNETNRELLARLAGGIRKGGRIVLDLWTPDFFIAHQGERTLDTPSGPVRERKRFDHGRLRVHLTYPDGAEEDFDWQLFTPPQMKSFADSVGLTLATACTNFDSAEKPNAANPRIQFVLQKDD